MALFELPPRTCSVATGEATPTPKRMLVVLQLISELEPNCVDELPNGIKPAVRAVSPVPPLLTCTGTAKDVPQAEPVDTAMPVVG